MNLQPTIFISSTISEFKDLRSAIRYVLSKSVYRVLMSELNDFGVTSNEDSLESCKLQIEKSDFYILIIGNEKGTEFALPSKEKSSVTKEEFKHFHKIFKQNNSPNIIVFIKKETWGNYKSNNTNGKTDIFQLQFIKEIIDSDTDNKILGKWVYRFDTFEDIITVIETNQNGLFLEETRKQNLLRIYLKKELTKLFKELVDKKNDGTLLAHGDMLEIPEANFENMFREIKLTRKQSAHLLTLIVSLQIMRKSLPSINRIFHYIIQGEFSFFNPSTSKYEQPEFIKATIQCLEMLEKNICIVSEDKHYEEIKNKLQNSDTIREYDCSRLHSLHMDMKLITSKFISLIYYFEGNMKGLPKMEEQFYDYRGVPVKDIIRDEDVYKYVEEHFKRIKEAIK
ncbi:MAG: DUF4062 domain-containing protein [Bacteroidetes bacterium]|nr:DUF4062 domain-containing protein [Bacteroidota bacterium]